MIGNMCLKTIYSLLRRTSIVKGAIKLNQIFLISKVIMKNLYLVTLNSDEHILIVASNKELASDYCLPIMSFGQWVEDVEFIAVVGGDYQEGEIIKKF